MSDSLRIKIDLIMTKVQILKLKANDHDWQCYTPDYVKNEMEEMLTEIDLELCKIKESEGEN